MFNRNTGTRSPGYTGQRRADQATAAKIRQGLASRALLEEDFGPVPVDDPSERPTLGVEFTIQDGRLLVVEVAPRSAAARAGLPPEAELISVNGVPVSSPGDVATAITRNHRGLPIHLTWRFAGRDAEADVIL